MHRGRGGSFHPMPSHISPSPLYHILALFPDPPALAANNECSLVLVPALGVSSPRARLRIKGRSRGFGAAVFASNGFSQEEVLQHKLILPPCKRTTADLAGYLVILRLRPCFDFDYLIKSFALWACEWIECTSRHGTPPANSRLLTYGTLVRAVAQPIPFNQHRIIRIGLRTVESP